MHSPGAFPLTSDSHDARCADFDGRELVRSDPSYVQHHEQVLLIIRFIRVYQASR